MNKSCQEKLLVKMRLISSDDLEEVRLIVRDKFSKFFKRDVCLDTYHEVISDSEHADFVQDKLNRVLTEEESDHFLALDSLSRFFRRFPSLRLSQLTYGNLVHVAKPVIYLRVVRPLSEGDVGPFHADRWFEEVYQVPYDSRPSIKLWLSIATEPKLNGLEFSSLDSRAVNFVTVITASGPKPRIDTKLDIAPLLPEISPGECFLFSDDILHRGALNVGSRVRCSLEMAFFGVPMDFKRRLTNEFNTATVFD